ncbi:ABC transporter substrate-binding protein [Psychrobacillus sp. OK032]|uniref:ABC transporter substrate-binding protein n=1 Tax=Psychrobacillus sp. OK032 TaxID=1884358 RepID=UPI0008B06270|nr:ABC transporter substrate-binding protein [Psychrobacillus sp. OK032]SER78095.1 peptide/nickel transport system substrate-binding protein/glutathione transport system substrate-binding protein [Psychrobacillus sp. OK032]
MRRTKTFKFCSIMLLLVFLVIMSACESDESSASSATSDKSIVVALTGEANSLDPHNTTDTASKQIYSVMTETLVGLNENGEVVPLLAKSWENSEDGKTWTFQLEEGVEFTDGTPFNAEAVKINFERVTNEENKLARYPMLGPYLDSITTNGDYEVVFHLNSPVGPFLNILAFPSGSNIISPKTIEEGIEAVRTNPIGTGPYKIKNWSPGTDTVFEANPNYWGGTPQLDQITFKVVPENASRVLMLETGEVDIIADVPATDIERINNSEETKVNSIEINRTLYVGINNSVAPFDKVEVRQALNYAIDKVALTNDLYEGRVKESSAIVSSKDQMYSNAGTYPYDLEKAKEMLKKAGVKEGTKVRLVAAGNAVRDHKAGQYVQTSLQLLGFDVEFQMLELNDYLNTLDDPSKYELYLRGGIANTNDAYDILRDSFYSDSKYNYARYINPNIDQAIEKGAIEPIIENRKKIYEEAFKEIKEDAPWIFLYEDTVHIGMRSNIEGLIVPPTHLWNYTEVRKSN